MKLTPLPPLPVLLPRAAFLGDPERINPDTLAATYQFLVTDDPDEDITELWNAHSGVQGALNAKPRNGSDEPVGLRLSARKKAEYYFDVVTGRYRYVISDRLVPVSRMRLGVLRVSKWQEGQMRDLTQRMVNGEISEARWYRGMRKLMKDQYRTAWIASIGGKENYDKRQQALFGKAMSPQYHFLDNFLNELNSGKQGKNGFAISRAAMYARAGNAIYQNNLLAVARSHGFKKVARILGETEQHCHNSNERWGCVEIAGWGYVDMDDMIPIGDAVCLSNCLCQYKFRR